MLKVENVSKRFGAKRELRGVSLAVRAGEVVRVAGENGTGKSTLHQIVCGVLPADEGRVAVCGRDVRRERAAALGALGYAPEGADLPSHLRAREWMDLLAAIKGPRRGDPFETEDFAHLQVTDLSLGQRRRLLLTCAWMGAPRLLVLDEPTNGLDARSVDRLAAEIAAHVEGGGAALLTTHDAPFAERVGARSERLERGVLGYSSEETPA